MIEKIFFLSFVSLSMGIPLPDGSPAYGPPPVPAPVVVEHDHKGMPYDFAYRVDDELSANHFGQSESSDGNRVTGEYRVLLPDGRTQIVKYYADHVSGFVADVSYEGTAIVVGPPIPAPGYGAPSPSPRPSPRPPLPPPPPSVTPGYGPPSPAYDGLDY